jgi:hypothetical protein
LERRPNTQKSSGPWRISASPAVFPDVRFVTLSRAVRLAFPPLLLSSLPKRAIGFSYPSGREGRVLGVALLSMTFLIGFLLSPTLGLPGFLLMAWLTGGTASLMLYNSTVGRVAFVKSYCSTCRLRPLIEEHEAMHLYGEPSEDVVWGETKKKYTYEGLSLANDPKICSFCPIAKKLRTH